MFKSIKFLITTICILFIFLISTSVYADNWSTFLNGENENLIFTDPEDTGEGYITIPFVLTVSGCWNEYWSGNSNYAELVTLNHAAIIENIANSSLPVENLEPFMEYDDNITNSSWSIVYSYPWVLNSSDWMYYEGYNNPGTWYCLGNLKTTGEVYIYIPDSMELYKYVNYYFR
ncbi:hypothetical protein ACETAC_05950 [Aceticella autotrophica]|uniref:Uncharacterized protein n=1 Tax=Aceticella autotrophica TaxID=2755338 RepID=A0A974Y455_9THEO|nr:hypothetical protein [Aceticella autotrophica]QSZ26467.1 hypothetical protein ACETAC_05950 [Aceticella autotrophica]